jgi:hypothetical protein
MTHYWKRGTANSLAGWVQNHSTRAQSLRDVCKIIREILAWYHSSLVPLTYVGGAEIRIFNLVWQNVWSRPKSREPGYTRLRLRFEFLRNQEFPNVYNCWQHLHGKINCVFWQRSSDWINQNWSISRTNMMMKKQWMMMGWHPLKTWGNGLKMFPRGCKAYSWLIHSEAKLLPLDTTKYTFLSTYGPKEWF